jgi:hypothetical protein
MTNTEQWNPTQARKSIPRGRIERWLGKEKAERMSLMMAGWYGPPINIRDIPGSVWLDKNGEFVGDFQRGFFDSAEDAFERHIRRNVDLFKRALHPDIMGLYAGAGFTSLADAVNRASQGHQQNLNGGMIAKAGPTGVANVCSSLWRVGSQPAAGGAGSAAPGGRTPTQATTGAITKYNPASGTLHLTGADFAASVALNCLLIYDRIFDVAKTMSSTATESVTGAPTRYQSSVNTNADYAGGNFLFMEVFAALGATAHNWTTCLYRDDAGTDSQTLPSVTGNSGAIIDRYDMPANSWFCPLASGDVGIMDLAQMQCSASVTGSLNFVIGHPLGFMAFPLASILTPFDWLTNRSLTPRIFDDACIALSEMPKPSTTATTYTGQIYATGAAA